jgi:hypothetical protein
MDQHYITTKASYVRPRHWKERLFLEMEAGVATRFAPLLALCTHHGQPNASVRAGALKNAAGLVACSGFLQLVFLLG